MKPAKTTRRPPEREAVIPGLATRRAALDVLLDIHRDGHPLDEAFETAVIRHLARAEPRERALVRALTAAALRRHAELDARADAHFARALPANALRTRLILRLGAAELLVFRTPPHAAVSLAVALAKSHRGSVGTAGLINAVLRKIAAEPPLEPISAETARLNLPGWLIERWTRTYGDAAAASIALASLTEPPLDLTWLAPAEAAIDPPTPHLRLPTGTIRLSGPSGPIEALPGYAQGAFFVQDAAAAIAPRLLDPKPGERILDLCAAPGGKTALLAAAGAHVIAVDRDAARATRLEANLRRLRLQAELHVADATTLALDAPVQKVLLDAPCSATGTIRRHPDIPHLRRPEGLLRLTQDQSALLDAAARQLAPGGWLVYAVCSLEPEEGEAQVAAFLARHPTFRALPIAPQEVPSLEAFLTDDGALRILPSAWPEHGGIDGFYIARLARE